MTLFRNEGNTVVKHTYDDIYAEFVKSFKEEANTLISDADIEKILSEEEARLACADRENIEYSSYMGSNMVKYAKDTLRRHQPLFGLYQFLSILTQLGYCFLLWGVLKYIYCYFTGYINSFSEPVSFSLSTIIILIFIPCLNIKQSYLRKYLSRVSDKNAKHNKNRSFYLVYSGIYTFVILALTAVLYISFNINSIRCSLMNIFLFAVTLLFLSGIHNVLYSSHFITFMSVGGFAVMKKPEVSLQNATQYKDSVLTQYLAQHKYTLTKYKTDTSIQTDFAKVYRHKIINYRVYCAIAFFITGALDFICFYQLISAGASYGFSIFAVISLLITLILLAAIISCNKLLKI